MQAVRYRPVTVLKITNTSGVNQQARVAVTSTGLTLTRTASGVKSTDTSITFAGNVTLTAVATAVTALGNGWERSNSRRLQPMAFSRSMVPERQHDRHRTQYQRRPGR